MSTPSQPYRAVSESDRRDEPGAPTCFVCDHDGPLREGQGGLMVCEDGPACADRNSDAPVRPACTRPGCGRPWSEHDYGQFCP